LIRKPNASGRVVRSGRLSVITVALSLTDITPFLFVWNCSSVRKGYLSEDTQKHGWVCVLEEIVVPSRLRSIRKTVVLTRVLPTLDLNCEKNTVRRKWKSPLFDYKETFMYYERQVRICL
jgi:hypothetical protein